MITPRLVMILASAGSGKTFALTNRFIALLAAGAEPERIVALTFTRKAAGEFFDGILGKLARAAADEKEACQLAGEIGQPQLGRADFLRLLRAMIEALHRLRLGTLDSFFAQVAQAFPFELGLAGDFEILEGHAARVERARGLRLLFARGGGGKLDDAQRGFLEAFKQATFGTEEKRLAERMDRFLDEKYETFLEVPAAERWGGVDAIWSGHAPWQPLKPLAPAVNGLRRWLETAALSDKHRVRWVDFLVSLEGWSAGAPWPKPMVYVLEKALVVCPALAAGTAELKFDRTAQPLDLVASHALADIAAHVAGGELQRQIEMTRGVHAVLAHFDAIYGGLVRRAGKLTFGDVTRLLRPDGGGRTLSFADAEDGRLMLDYRLDARIDHWLLDEFQDTSRSQWSVLRNLIDEVVQDADERRTFFCVGDVKQSIYGWREGDPTLMRDIRRHYNGSDDAPGPIVTQPLDASWRSGPAVIEMVNGVFGAERVLESLFPKAAVERWTDEWRAHTTERPKRDGQAALLFAADKDERARRTLEIIQEIDPLGRGLSCAVLTRSNDQATALADFLRREGGIAAVAESDLQVATDQPLGAALLALVQAAAHPGDRFAWEHVGMSPLGAALDAAGLGDRAAATRAVLRQISEEGFERWAEHWIARVPVEGAFTAERARQFAAAAALFDATGTRDPDEFLRFMADYVQREAESAAVVRVMTIHKSKGLGFDVVILPELQTKKLDLSPSGLSVHRGAQHAAEWVLELPKKEIVEAEPVLSAHAAGAAADACYEAMSLLYVAMTRAKHAMFVVVEKAKDSANYPRWIVEALGDAAGEVTVGTRQFAGGWSAGNPTWFHAMAARPAAEAAVFPEKLAVAPVARHAGRRPSGEGVGERDAARLFAGAAEARMDFGAAVHRLLKEVEWTTPGAGDEWAATWTARGVAAEVVAHTVAALRAPGLADLWRAPADGGGVDVWRERAFEIVLGGEWVSGVFDRVIVRRGADGRAIEATVVDFKTEAVSQAPDELDRAARRHAGQLNLYRSVLARLVGLPESAVRAEVVFTGSGRRLTVGPAF